MKDNNYYIVQGWMINKLKLKGAKLIVYAIINGFCQDGVSEYKGSYQYLADGAGISRRSAIRVVLELISEGLIKKDEKGAVNSFKVVTKCHPDSDKMSPPGSDKMSPNNNIIHKDININTQKHKYGEYKNVLLTDEEYKKLEEKFSNPTRKIQDLDEGIELKGYKYKSHYLAILKWAKKDEGFQPESSGRINKKRFDFDK